MGNVTFTDRLIHGIQRKKSILCVGIDPQLRFIPPQLIDRVRDLHGDNFAAMGYVLEDWARAVIGAVEPYAVAIKPNSAFFERYGHWGIWALEQIIQQAHDHDLEVVCDMKRGDGGDTAEAYAQAYLGEVPFFGGTVIRSPLQADAITINCWTGTSCVGPFLDLVKSTGKGVFVVVKTSFIPNSEVEQIQTQEGIPIWQAMARLVQQWGQGTEGPYGYRNFGAVVGAIYPEQAVKMREILPKAWFLIPGYGAQGGGADEAVIGLDKDGLGGFVNSSRAISTAWQNGPFKCAPQDFAKALASAAEAARDDLNAALQRAGKISW